MRTAITLRSCTRNTVATAAPILPGLSTPTLCHVVPFPPQWTCPADLTLTFSRIEPSTLCGSPISAAFDSNGGAVHSVLHPTARVVRAPGIPSASRCDRHGRLFFSL